MFALEIIEQAYDCLDDGELTKAYNLFVRASRSNPTPADNLEIRRGLQEIDRLMDGEMTWPPGF